MSLATTPGVGSRGQVDQPGDGVGALLMCSAQERHDPSRGLGPRSLRLPPQTLRLTTAGPIPRSAPPVRGIDAVDDEEAEKRRPLVAEVRDRLAVEVVEMGLFQHRLPRPAPSASMSSSESSSEGLQRHWAYSPLASRGALYKRCADASEYHVNP